MILYLLLIHFQAWEFERPFCLRCLHEIANLCATYGHHMLLLLLFVLLPLQSHFTPLPSKEKKKPNDICIRSDERITLETSAKSFTVVIQPLATRLIKPNFWCLYIISYPDLTLSLEMWDVVKFDFEHAQCQRDPKYGLFFHCACSYSLLWFCVILRNKHGFREYSWRDSFG